MTLATRIRNTARAFSGQDVTTEQGIQKTVDGAVYTLAKFPVALWVETEDYNAAHGTLAVLIEGALGEVAWNEPEAMRLAKERARV